MQRHLVKFMWALQDIHPTAKQRTTSHVVSCKEAYRQLANQHLEICIGFTIIIIGLSGEPPNGYSPYELCLKKLRHGNLSLAAVCRDNM